MYFTWKSVTYEVKHLGDAAALIEPHAVVPLPVLYELAAAIRQSLNNSVIDVVVSQFSLTIYFTQMIISINEIVVELLNLDELSSISRGGVEHIIEVDFECGLDWAVVEEMCQLTKHQIITRFTEQEYTVTMLGFVPGFIYLSGLPSELASARKATPRKKIPAGAVGIGGEQAGIYTLPSPGGWQIIGQTKQKLFHPQKNPPTVLRALDKVYFKVV